MSITVDSTANVGLNEEVPVHANEVVHVPLSEFSPSANLGFANIAPKSAAFMLTGGNQSRIAVESGYVGPHIDLTANATFLTLYLTSLEVWAHSFKHHVHIHLLSSQALQQPPCMPQGCS